MLNSEEPDFRRGQITMIGQDADRGLRAAVTRHAAHGRRPTADPGRLRHLPDAQPVARYRAAVRLGTGRRTSVAKSHFAERELAGVYLAIGSSLLKLNGSSHTARSRTPPFADRSEARWFTASRICSGRRWVYPSTIASRRICVSV